jgi:pimeloyl-ACP methyl ester carboxylesterase
VPFTTVKGLSVHYATEGSLDPGHGPGIVFVHGAGGTHEHWRFQLRQLAIRWNALAVDLPGHGESQGDGYSTIPDYRDFLRDLLDALGFSRAVLVGHSMGGGIAQGFALTYPDRLAALVLVGTGARLRVHPDIFTAIHRDMGEAGRLISGWSYSSTAMLATVASAAEAFARNRASVLEGDFRACDAFDLMGEIPMIRIPTLIVCGEDDRLTPAKYARSLHDKIPGSALTIIPGAGHMVMVEKPVEFNRVLTTFLDSHLRPTT